METDIVKTENSALISERTIEIGKDHLLFDGDCGICTYLSDYAKSIKGSREFVVLPYQLITEKELGKFGVTYRNCERALQVITKGSRVYSGAFGVNYFLWHRFPWSIVVAVIYLLPVLLLLEVIVYRVVAANRHHISRWFGLKACLLQSEKYK